MLCYFLVNFCQSIGGELFCPYLEYLHVTITDKSQLMLKQVIVMFVRDTFALISPQYVTVGLF